MTKEATVRNAMKLALEALENHSGNYKLSKSECVTHNAAIDALREALNASLAEQPTTQPLVVPDLLTTLDPETPEYRNGWNDCRQLMMEMHRKESK